MAAVQNAVQNGIENLSGTSVSSNAHPGDGYRYRARTREELIQSQELAANHGVVRAGQEAQDPAAMLDAAAPLPRDNPPSAPKGWLL